MQLSFLKRILKNIAALSALTRSLAFDLSEIGVRVNSISPGYIKTNMTKKSYLSKKKENPEQIE